MLGEGWHFWLCSGCARPGVGYGCPQLRRGCTLWLQTANPCRREDLLCPWVTSSKWNDFLGVSFLYEFIQVWKCSAPLVLMALTSLPLLLFCNPPSQYDESLQANVVCTQDVSPKSFSHLTCRICHAEASQPGGMVVINGQTSEPRATSCLALCLDLGVKSLLSVCVTE